MANTRLRRAVFLSPLRLLRFRTQRRRNRSERWILDAPDQLMPTYESWIVRRESWLPPFPLNRRYDRDPDATGRFEFGGPDKASRPSS
jgi:hypothetical protein